MRCAVSRDVQTAVQVRIRPIGVLVKVSAQVFHNCSLLTPTNLPEYTRTMVDFRFTTVTIAYIVLGHGYVYNAKFLVYTLRLWTENYNSDYNLARTASAPETVTSLPGSDWGCV